MSLAAKLMILVLVAMTVVIFFGLGWLLKRKWKRLIIIPVSLLLIAASLAIYAFYDSNKYCNIPNPGDFCGLGAALLIAGAFAVVCAALVTAILGLPAAWFGNKKSNKR